MRKEWAALFFFFFIFNLTPAFSLEGGIKEPNVAGGFYPDDPQELSGMIDKFLAAAKPQSPEGEIFALISPHAGYGFSGPAAAFGYKLVEGRPYKTVVVIGSSHHYGFSGISVYPSGAFRTPLGDIPVDQEFAAKLLSKDSSIVFEPAAFAKEHSVEVQLPFLQRALAGFQIVPVVMGDCTLDECLKFAGLLKDAVAGRKDLLIIASTDMYHGYDYEEADRVDAVTLSGLKGMDAEKLYYALREGQAQLCGGFGVVAVMAAARKLGHDKLIVLNHTNSAIVTQEKVKGRWTVGYTSCVIDQPEKEAGMLNKEQRKRLLEIARSSIKNYLETGKKPDLSEADPVLAQNMGAFVTLHKNGQLRGCIGTLTGNQPLYLTVRDMSVEAAVDDWRFPNVEPGELKDIEIEISALSPLEKIDDPARIELGRHGVIVRKGSSSGVFLPQVATETGWSKEEFLSQLCAHKAGLAADAWKDKSTELFIFTAEVFSEKND